MLSDKERLIRLRVLKLIAHFEAEGITEEEAEELCLRFVLAINGVAQPTGMEPS